MCSHSHVHGPKCLRGSEFFYWQKGRFQGKNFLACKGEFPFPLQCPSMSSLESTVVYTYMCMGPNAWEGVIGYYDELEEF